MYCVNCVLFGKSNKESKYRAFSYEPVTDWSNLPHLAKRHCERNEGHKTACMFAENFLCVANKEKDDIHTQVNNQHREIVLKNRAVLASIIKCLLFCAQQNIALRGHGSEEGNFMALIKFHSQHDQVLKHHLATAPRNARYLSPKIQNELINACAEVLRADIVADCNNAGMFALLADECTDVATREQISLCVRFIDRSTAVKIREEFLGFVLAPRTTGAALTRTFLQALQDYGIYIDNMRAQSYDGAPNMSGIHNGVQALVKRQYPHAAYIYCKAHCLNICIVHACRLPLIRNMMDTLQQVAFSFKYSAKRLAVYDDELSENEDALAKMNRKTKLQALCETRWASRAKALTTFKDSIEVIISSLNVLSDDGDAKARAFRESILKFDFLVTLIACEHIFKLLAPLSEYLQGTNVDLVEACREAQINIDILSAERQDDTVWDMLYEGATETAQLFDVEPRMPRMVRRQQHRENAEAANPSEYWKRNMYLPVMDHLTNEMQEKLMDNRATFTGQHLIANQVAGITAEQREEIYRAFEHDLTGRDDFDTEVERWKVRCGHMEHPLPSTLIDTLEALPKDLYPNTAIILQTLLTYPVTTASNERSFSALKRVKTYLRASMGEERLSSLALLHSQKDKDVDVERVIDCFSGSTTRRIALCFEGHNEENQSSDED